MKGRLESELRYRDCIFRILKDLPPYVEDLYYIMQTSGLEPSTCWAYLSRIRHFIKNCGCEDMAKINPQIVARYFDSINFSENSTEMKKTSITYKKQTWTALNHLFTHLLNTGIIQANPMCSVKRAKKKDNVKRVFMDTEDLNAILDSSKQGSVTEYAKRHNRIDFAERDYLIVTLLMVTGMRKTALCEINVDSYSSRTKILTVIDKGGKEQRYKFTKEVESVWRDWICKRKEILGNVKCDALFISERKKRLHPNSIEYITKKYSNKALGTEMSPHKFRRAFGRGTYERNGYDIEATRKAMGHESVSTTEIYICDSDTSRDEAIATMVNVLNI